MSRLEALQGYLRMKWLEVLIAESEEQAGSAMLVMGMGVIKNG